MRTAVIPVCLGLSALMVAGCGTPTKNTSLNSNVDNSKTTAAAPTSDALLALDKQANEAYIKSDSKFFERMLKPVVNVLMPIPSLAWVPLIVLWFGIGNAEA